VAPRFNARWPSAGDHHREQTLRCFRRQRLPARRRQGHAVPENLSGGNEVFPLVNNFDPVANDFVPGIADFFARASGRENFRKQMLDFLATDKYRGVMIDFESFPRSAQANYQTLLAELGGDLHARGMKLYTAVPVRDDDFNLAEIASRVDGVVLMNYDEHFPAPRRDPSPRRLVHGKSGRSRQVCSKRQNHLRHRELRLRLDGERKERRGQCRGQPLGAGSVLGASDSEEDIDFDPDALNPHYTYRDDKNHRHDVWFSTARPRSTRCVRRRRSAFELSLCGGWARRITHCGACGTFPAMRPLRTS